MKDMITQEILKHNLTYDPLSGLFSRKLDTPNTNIGDIAGGKNKKGYIIISINSRLYRAHRLAWLYVNNSWPEQIDHISGVRDDNKYKNLRDVDNTENHKNMKMNSRNKSGKMGVSFCKKSSKWVAEIRFKGKKIWLGGFSDKADAIEVREKAEILYGYHKNHGRK